MQWYTATVIELREFNDWNVKKKKNYIDKILKLNLGQKDEIFGTQITFDMFCSVKSLKVKLM